MIGIAGAAAQSGDSKPQDQSGKPAAAAPADVAKDNQRKTDEFAEAAQAINGPAGNPECVWFGRRVVRLMFLDDIDTALRHLDLYDRFGCPGGQRSASDRGSPVAVAVGLDHGADGNVRADMFLYGVEIGGQRS